MLRLLNDYKLLVCDEGSRVAAAATPARYAAYAVATERRRRSVAGA